MGVGGWGAGRLRYGTRYGIKTHQGWESSTQPTAPRAPMSETALTRGKPKPKETLTSSMTSGATVSGTKMNPVSRQTDGRARGMRICAGTVTLRIGIIGSSDAVVEVWCCFVMRWRGGVVWRGEAARRRGGARRSEAVLAAYRDAALVFERVLERGVGHQPGQRVDRRPQSALMQQRLHRQSGKIGHSTADVGVPMSVTEAFATRRAWSWHVIALCMPLSETTDPSPQETYAGKRRAGTAMARVRVQVRVRPGLGFGYGCRLGLWFRLCGVVLRLPCAWPAPSRSWSGPACPSRLRYRATAPPVP